MVQFVRVYGVSAFTTIVVWAGIAALLGPAALMAVAILTLLEVTFSIDNAVVNSKLVGLLSPRWQRLFMTAGILVAVVVVRFALPTLIVAFTAGLPVAAVIELMLHQAGEYGAHLNAAGPMIDAFGGTFLLMLATGFFLDAAKQIHWIGALERRLAPLGRYDNLGILAMALGILVMFFTTDGAPATRAAIMAAALCGLTLHVGLDVLGRMVDADPTSSGDRQRGRHAVGLVGFAAAGMFLRLELVDASFSFDSVIAAFAITSSILVIDAGLGAGAVWVRSMTVHLVRSGTLAKYRYLEHGAHWAIAALGALMIAKLYGIELSEWATGSVGIVLIAAAVVSSVVEGRRAYRTSEPHTSGTSSSITISSAEQRTLR